MLTKGLLDRAGPEAEEGHSGAVTLIQRFGPAGNLKTNLHRMVLEGVYLCGADGVSCAARLYLLCFVALQETHMIKLSVNGKTVSVDADADMPLLWALREQLQLTGTKFGCGMSLCGSCMVHLDGKPVRSCSTPLSAAAGRKITTIEGIGSTRIGKAVQAAWVSHDVPQCGYCQSGQIMSACALLADMKVPSDADIDSAMSGNLCRCGTYNQIRAAIKDASTLLAKGA